MRLFRIPKGIVLENENKFYLSENEDWETFINDDNVFEKAIALCNKIPEGDSSLVTDTLPVIGSNQELWACGVTYYRSMVGRQEESQASGGADFYGKVYEAERPECFFKSTPFRVVGDKGFVRIRKDSTWDVPEPELTLVVTASKKIIGYTIGNDMSSRSIEGENPLYLPQAKTYDGCAAVGPCVYLTNEPLSPDTLISLLIERNGTSVFEGSIELNKMKRTLEELVDFIYRESSFPAGCLIMTGTGIVPDNSFTLQSGDSISISIDAIGTLTNLVK
ncbi:MAG: fumarylacetoacetate hydrolase family protein [Ferruginibacter sp.]